MILEILPFYFTLHHSSIHRNWSWAISAHSNISESNLQSLGHMKPQYVKCHRWICPFHACERKCENEYGEGKRKKLVRLTRAQTASRRSNSKNRSLLLRQSHITHNFSTCAKIKFVENASMRTTHMGACRVCLNDLMRDTI